ncbi:MAG: hypothetical protein KY476_13980 [Planctomycetes bacterium]|nr:hypothetical protein [Planctomycetota bacterium]
MSPSAILEHRRREPFQPFRIVLSDGTSYEVTAPEWVMVTAMDIVVATGPTVRGVPERLVCFDPTRVSAIEPKRPEWREHADTDRRVTH